MRPWHYWTAFVLCVVVVAVAMGWVSLTAMRLDRAQADAQRQAAFEENVRLALWRMETAVAPILARESARPYFVYAPFYPAERAYTMMFQEVPGSEVLVPSPLLKEPAPQVIIYFQIAPDGSVTSPQVPTEMMWNLAVSAYENEGIISRAAEQLETLRNAVSRDGLLAVLPEARTETTAPQVTAALNAVVVLDRQTMNSPAQVSQGGQYAMNAVVVRDQQAVNVPAQASQGGQNAMQQPISEMAEWDNRNQQQFESQKKGNPNIQQPQKQARGKGSISAHVSEGMLRSIWVGDMLILARRVNVNGQDYIQGCRLDWEEIKNDLIGKITDLLGEPTLFPVASGVEVRAGRMLAGLPVRLDPGIPAAFPARGPTPVALSLLIAWICVLLAAGAVGILLAGAVSLSERRGAFVSAVTHELRTPLTTFRMYSEMLAEGMVRDEAKKQRYLATLCSEGNRLHHLVENVLSYARLERGRHGGHTERVCVGEVVGRIRERLAQRAEQAGMQIAVDVPEDMLAAELSTDLSALEQILFNLVDNACKYAADGQDKRIHWAAERTDGKVLFRVRDHGPGILPGDARRLFKPFRKSAKHAAESAPGVGLGLALSRRLARHMGGDLRIDPNVRDGACLELSIPG